MPTHITIPFTKLQGLGNDFVLIDAIQQAFDLSAALIRQMADRHYGIGFDQLLLIQASTQTGIDFAYRIFNADGSEVSQCGNGARCVGHYLWEQGLTKKQTIILGTAERLLEVSKTPENEIRVNMGVPILEPRAIPFEAEQLQTVYELQLQKQTIHFGAVNLGNPHIVLQVQNLAQADVTTLGPLLEHHPHFPAGVNVGFMQIINRQNIRLRVYERGAGETLACGSGACAAAVVGQLQGLLDPTVQVALNGGELTIHWQGGGHSVSMIGPAKIVFTGQWIN